MGNFNEAYIKATTMLYPSGGSDWEFLEAEPLDPEDPQWWYGFAVPKQINAGANTGGWQFHREHMHVCSLSAGDKLRIKVAWDAASTSDSSINVYVRMKVKKLPEDEE